MYYTVTNDIIRLRTIYTIGTRKRCTRSSLLRRCYEFGKRGGNHWKLKRRGYCFVLKHRVGRIIFWVMHREANGFQRCNINYFTICKQQQYRR